ncbi:hypothetical protein [Streptomyces sp. NPDC047525]|uniref:hypothetical protein n=1 Tax=Streptomyces sp. NPDC047525 TaxID=3155264 RepID=UPI0033F9DF6C
MHEITRHGWLRWDVAADEQFHPHGRLQEAGIFMPAQSRGWRWLSKTVWGRRPPTYIWALAGHELPRPVPLVRALVFTATALAALSPALALLPAPTRLLAAGLLGALAAAGVPAATQQATRRRVRVVGEHQLYAPVYFRLLAGEQQLRRLAQHSERPELARAVAIMPGLLWDAAGLVPLAENCNEARDFLLGYEESLSLLVEQGVEVEREEAAVERAIREDPVPTELDVGTAPLPGALMPRSALDEARRDLEELEQGLRHARSVLRDDGDAGSTGKEEDHDR